VASVDSIELLSGATEVWPSRTCFRKTHRRCVARIASMSTIDQAKAALEACVVLDP